MDEHGINTKRVTVGALTLALVMVLLGVQVSTAPPALAASVAVNPVAGEPGSSATVSGSAFLPLVAVDLCWGGQGCSNLGSATPDVAGEFSTGIGIPSGIAAGSYTIGACQGVTGCVETSFVVLSRPDDSSTLPSTSSTTTTTTAAPPTTVTSTTTTTRGPTTTTRGPTTTRPVPTTVGTTPTTTSPGQAPPSTAGIVGAPGSTTTTTTPGVEAIAADQPLADAATPFALDIEALMTDLFAPEPPVDLTDPGAVGSAAGLGVPLAATAVDDAEEEDDEGGISTVVAAESGGFFGFEIPKFGIWIIWLVVILGITALVLTADEWRRRRAR